MIPASKLPAPLPRWRPGSCSKCGYFTPIPGRSVCSICEDADRLFSKQWKAGDPDARKGDRG